MEPTTEVKFRNLLPEYKDNFYMAGNERMVENKTMTLIKDAGAVCYVEVDYGICVSKVKIHKDYFDNIEFINY